MSDAIIKRLIPYSIVLGVAAAAVIAADFIVIPAALRISVLIAVLYSVLVLAAMFFLKSRALASDPRTAFFLVFAGVFLNILSAFILLAVGSIFALDHAVLLFTFAVMYPIFYLGLAIYVFGGRHAAKG